MENRVGEIREDHEECGDNRARKYTRRTSNGRVWFCHNCGERGFEPDGPLSASETIRRVQSSRLLGEVLEQSVRDIHLPSDCNVESIPVAGWAWLNKYYITQDEVLKYGIGYSERYKRLVLPVFVKDRLVYWQGRNLKAPPYPKDNPKYLNIRASGAKNVFFRINHARETRTLVVVEDILSAIRVGRTGTDSLALLGSYFPTLLLNLFKPYDEVLIYLDDDKWKESIKAAIRFSTLSGIRFVVKRNVKDPKELTPEALSAFLGERL